MAPCVGTETISPRLVGMDAWPDWDVLHMLWEAQLAAVASVGAALPALERAAKAATAALARGGRLCCAGAGTSGRVAAQEIAELEPTFGWPETRTCVLLAGGEAALSASVEGAEDDAETARAAVRARALGADDVLLGIAASGSTPYVLAAVAEARARGAVTVGVACVGESPLLAGAAYPVLVATGAEPVAGSTRLKGGTAQKVVLNLFTTLVMTRLGHVHDGMMVDMRPRNSKLRERARAMVVRIAGCTEAQADGALARADGNVKRAALVARGLSRAQAETLLARTGGSLRAALGQLA